MQHIEAEERAPQAVLQQVAQGTDARGVQIRVGQTLFRGRSQGVERKGSSHVRYCVTKVRLGRAGSISKRCVCLARRQSDLSSLGQRGGVEAEVTAMGAVGHMHGHALVLLSSSVQVRAVVYMHVRQRWPTDHLGRGGEGRGVRGEGEEG